jgi:negative regulator of replication initiation
MFMVRKQLYIDDEQERQLKARSQEMGISESEIVRRLLDRGLSDGTSASTPRRAAEEHIEAFLSEAAQISKSVRLVPHERDDLYPDRGVPRRR